MTKPLPVPTEIDRLIASVVTEVRAGDAKRDEALEHYKNAGQALIELKKLVSGQPGGFRATVSGMPDIQKTQAYALMKLAREWPVSWDRWQEIQGHKKPDATKPAPAPTPPPDPEEPAFREPTETDLDYARKLIEMKNRGGTENERKVAARKLDVFAQNFGMSSSDLEEAAAPNEPEQPANTGMTTYHELYAKWFRECRVLFSEADRGRLLAVVAQLYTELELAGVEPPTTYHG